MPVGGRKLSIEEALALSYAVGFRLKPLRTAVAVMTAESGRYVEAYNVNLNSSVDRGLFQINTIHTSLGMANSFRGAPNATFAFLLSDAGTNFDPWNAFTSGAYKQFLPEINDIWQVEEWRKLVPTIEKELS
jgi:hypothetical protein